MSRPRVDLKTLVGIERQVKEIEMMLSLLSHRDVCIMGIWGMGGIGKTTLANVVFNRLSSKFASSCFLGNVREEWAKGRKNDLRKELFSTLLLEDNPYNARGRLSNKKALIVLDDVNDPEQPEHLIGDFSKLCGHGSIIIVTTRDLEMLRYIIADAKYEVESLNDEEAFELFVLHAFNGNLPEHTEYVVKISQRVLNYAQGIPLALRVLGSHLRCKERYNWESELNELEQSHNVKVQNVLKVSYDGLHEKDQQVFLDIACFFNGASRGYVENILNACGFFAKTNIDKLIDKSLLTVNKSNKLLMHDLAQEMGREIVLSTQESRKRSRLWIAQDVIHVLKNNAGNKGIQGIFLDTNDTEKVDLEPVVFEKMYNLRYLEIVDGEGVYSKLEFPQGLKSLPTELRYLDWCNYPLEFLPSHFIPHNLVELHMSRSNLKRLWTGVQHLVNLRHINLSFSQKLIEIPDLSQAPRLKSMNLEDCTSLVMFPSLNFQNSDEHTDSKESWDADFRNPGTLVLAGCSSLKSLPKFSGSIRYLILNGTAIEEFPTSNSALENLIYLNLSDCKLIENLGSGIHNLEGLKYLSLWMCSSINVFPENLPRNIMVLNLGGTTLEEVPSSIKYLSCLEEFRLSFCKRLVTLPTSICELKSLRELHLLACSELENFPEMLEPMGCLKTLDLSETRIMELPHSFDMLIGLHKLLLDGCGKLKFVPDTIIRMPSLKKLSLARCFLVEIPDWLGCLSSLEILDLRSNSIDKIPTSIKDLSRLIELQISDCKNLQLLPELPLSLGLLDASRCTSLKTVSHSKTAMVKCHWNDYQATHYKEFIFSDCLNLDQSALYNIVIDSQKLEERPSVTFCYPGNKIPEWFSYQSEKSSITIELPSNWNNNNFMGFALCVIVKDFDFRYNHVEVKCEFYFKTHNGKSYKFRCQFQENCEKEPTLRSYISYFKSDHILMWYKPDHRYRDFHDAVEASFEFELLLLLPTSPPFLLIRILLVKGRVSDMQMSVLTFVDDYDVGVQFGESYLNEFCEKKIVRHHTI
ncbi:disease resistance-like protein DSC1 [Morus notabilis]|uniref:disease resistance-like protein DSC1 n=1 Tax=Morus notabilis TaxID=981085 RepID=UPI000CED2E5B|nr:disease resistance-like protein DSC1 [Morus notabilis]